MLEALVITLREGVEAALVVGIILAYLHKTGKANLNRMVYRGLGAAVLQPLFQELILQGELPYQPLQFLYPVLESPFFSGLVVEFTLAVLSIPVVKHA